MVELRYYSAADGRSPFEDWFAGLDRAAAAKVTIALARLELGNFSSSKGVGEGVLEHRIDWGPGYRVYYGREGDLLVILLTGGARGDNNAISKERRRSGRTSSSGACEGYEANEMPLTKSFKDLVQRRVAEDPAFGEELLRESIDAMLRGDVDAGRAVLRDYIKATIGFEKLSEATSTPAKSLIRMFGPRGNPHARNLFNVLTHLQHRAGIELKVIPRP